MADLSLIMIQDKIDKTISFEKVTDLAEAYAASKCEELAGEIKGDYVEDVFDKRFGDIIDAALAKVLDKPNQPQ